jgi:hypothetical protein
MEEQSFYGQTGGVTLLVIKHKGKTFDYINGYKSCAYFQKWAPLLPFMSVDRCYVVACSVRLTRYGKADLMPFGIAFECTEQQAKTVSLQHRYDVEHGTWNAEEEYTKLEKDWKLFKEDFYRQLSANVELNKAKAKKALLAF